MNQKSIKNMILVVLFVILAPLILVGITSLGNSIAGKGKTAQTPAQTEQVAKVPEETKTTNENIPKANQERISNDSSQSNTNSNNNNSNTQNGQVSTNPTAGQDYVIKAGDSLFSIASAAYGEANAQSGVDKIKEVNNIENNNIAAGQRIQIPRL